MQCQIRSSPPVFRQGCCGNVSSDTAIYIVNHMDTDPLAEKSTSQDKSYIGTIPLHKDLHQEAVSALQYQIMGEGRVPLTYSVPQIQHFVGAD